LTLLSKAVKGCGAGRVAVFSTVYEDRVEEHLQQTALVVHFYKHTPVEFLHRRCMATSTASCWPSCTSLPVQQVRLPWTVKVCKSCQCPQWQELHSRFHSVQKHIQ